MGEFGDGNILAIGAGASRTTPAPASEGPSTSSPRLTIVVPTYRRPDLLVQSLRAIADQTFRDFVALVCDNSPEKDAQEVVANLHDDRFVYIARGRNIGMLANVLAGFRAATTPLVMEVDDDDILYPHCLESLVAPFSEQPDLSVVFGDLDVIDDHLRVLPHNERVAFQPSLDFLSPGRHQPFTDLAARGLVFLPASVLRRDAVDWDLVHESAATAYDRHLGLAAARHGAPGYHVKGPVMAYRVHDRSDGLQFTAQCISGAIEVLVSESKRSGGEGRASMNRELARSRLRLLRTHVTLRQRCAALAILAALLAPSSFAGLMRLVIDDYLPAVVGHASPTSLSALTGAVRARLRGPGTRECHAAARRRRSRCRPQSSADHVPARSSRPRG